MGLPLQDHRHSRKHRISISSNALPPLIFLKNASNPVSRVLSWMTIHLDIMSPRCSSDRPEGKAGHLMPLLFDLSPGGVYQATQLPARWCALTAPFHPCRQVGGLFSVALSLGSPPPGVTRHPALRSSDFPRVYTRGHPDCLRNLF